MPRRLWAEALVAFWLTFGGCGTAVLAATTVTVSDCPVGIGWLGVALAFGLTVLTGAYALGHLSGGHFHPAVTLGVRAAKRVETAAIAPSIVAQIVSASIAGGVLLVIASGAPGFAPLAIGLALTLIHLISIPVSNTSVDSARSLGVAWLAGPDALGQVRLFLVAPVVGALIAGSNCRALTGASEDIVANEALPRAATEA